MASIDPFVQLQQLQETLTYYQKAMQEIEQTIMRIPTLWVGDEVAYLLQALEHTQLEIQQQWQRGCYELQQLTRLTKRGERY